MVCLNPILIKNPLYYLDEKFEHKLDSASSIYTTPSVYVRCGHCLYCRAHRSSEIAMKIKHEYSTCQRKATFVTFTFNEKSVPEYHTSDDELLCGYDFDKSPLQKFFKNLRRQITYKKLPYRFKYLACGEYGSTTYRCHYHAILLGVSASEIEGLIHKCWNKDKIGFTKIVDCDANASRYVTKYLYKSETEDWYNSDYYRDTQDLLKRLSAVRVSLSACNSNCYSFTCPMADVLFEHPLFNRYWKYVDYKPRSLKESNYRIISQRCSFCTYAEDVYDMALALRRKIRDMFYRSHCLPFIWCSNGLGKEYCLKKASEFVRYGYVFDGNSKDGRPIKRGLPETYKRYLIDYLASISDYYDPSISWHDVCCNKRDWFDEYQRRCESPNWKLFDPYGTYSRGVLLDDLPGICQAYDSWLAEHLLEKRVRVQDDYWRKHRPKLH